MITKGLIILAVGVIGTITTIILWLIALLKAPEDVKTYFVYDNEGELTMINKGIYKTTGSETTLADGTATEVILEKEATKTQAIVNNTEFSKSKEKIVTETSVEEKTFTEQTLAEETLTKEQLGEETLSEVTELEVTECEVEETKVEAVEVENTIIEDTVLEEGSEKKEIDETEIEK